MKRSLTLNFVVAGLLSVSLSLGCGGDANRQPKVSLAMSRMAVAELPPIAIRRRNAPPPKGLRVVDLRKGSGAKVTPHDEIVVNYYSVRYSEAQAKTHRGEFGETHFTLDTVVDGWRLGLPGMRVGGRRELVVPARLAYPGGGTLIYVIDLLEVEPG